MKGYSGVNSILINTWFLKFFFKFSLSAPTCPWQRFPLHKGSSALTKEGNRTVCSGSLHLDNKYLKELQCSGFFHNHLFSRNCQLLVYQHDLLVTWQNWEIIFLAALDFHIPGPVWWNVRINCHPNTMFLFQNNPFQPSFTNTFSLSCLSLSCPEKTVIAVTLT